jgi:hypothetical protein
MEITIAQDRFTASISFTPRQLLILFFLMEEVCVEDYVWESLPCSLTDEWMEDILNFARTMEHSIKDFCDIHLPSNGVQGTPK